MRRTGWAFLGAAGIAGAPVAAAGLLYAELQLSKLGRPLLSRGDFVQDGLVGAGPGDGPPLRMVWLGDSSAVGVGASRAEAALPRRVASALGRPVELSVLAVNGARVRDVVLDQLPAVPALEPDLVVTCIGTNDALFLSTRDEVHDYHERLAADLAQRCPYVVVWGDLGAAPRMLQPLRATLGRRNRTLLAEARTLVTGSGGRFVDVEAALGPTLRRDAARLFCEDGLHLGDEGYALVAEAVLAELRPLLDRPEAGAGSPPDLQPREDRRAHR